MEFVIMGLMFILGGLIVALIALIYLHIQTNKDLEQVDIDIEQVLYLINEQEKEMEANMIEMDKIRESIKEYGR